MSRLVRPAVCRQRILEFRLQFFKSDVRHVISHELQNARATEKFALLASYALPFFLSASCAIGETW